MPPSSTPAAKTLSLSITNPLVLYRALVSTKKIRPDPEQHRLALHLQKLYFRLKDYAPEVEYRYRLEKIGRRAAKESRAGARSGKKHGSHLGKSEKSSTSDGYDGEEAPSGTAAPGFISSLIPRNLSSSLSTSSLALTRTTPLHDSALNIDSPLGMLLYGEVGRGKSMLLDLLYTSLPSRKKRRWHYNTFMLDVFRRIEASRLERLDWSEGSSSSLGSLFGRGGPRISEHEHVVLSLAKDTISESPILFLDEFQMPDRAASKLITSFFTAFFHLGGVLVASSNRMPEELSKAAGIEFGGQQQDPRRWGGAGFSGGFFGLGWGLSRASEGERAARTDFGKFVELLRARCEVWEMGGEKDWRREDDGDDECAVEVDDNGDDIASFNEQQTLPTSNSASLTISSQTLSSDSPPHYHISMPESPSSPSSTSPIQMDISALNPTNIWIPRTLTIYARNVHLPETHRGILRASFSSLCETYLGPADYISLCSHFHTLILTEVPVLTLTKKNEARRFITLLDALYEARCRLVIEAAAPPDKLFFPETRTRLRTAGDDGGGANANATAPPRFLLDDNTTSDDAITSEAFSEIYQDSTAPFRPNVSLYTDGGTPSSSSFYSPPPPPPPSPTLTRHLLADEDADFGPTYGNGRGHGISDSSVPPSHSLSLSSSSSSQRAGPDFTSTSALTGEDERFAYKRARSRLWEMCGRRWWDERLPPLSSSSSLGMKGLPRADAEDNADQYTLIEREEQEQEGKYEEDADVPAWWRPVTHEGRFWELQDLAPSSPDSHSPSPSTSTKTSPYNDSIGSRTPSSSSETSESEDESKSESTRDGHSTRDTTRSSSSSSSPYRKDSSAPPKFGWQHAWGMMRWGPKAGNWGQGVEGEKKKRQFEERTQPSQTGDEERRS